nr:hypothetical protein [uncultured archaeon]
MKKNSHIHILIETELSDRLRKQAEDLGMTFSDLCRQKLKDTCKLDRIEFIVAQIDRKLKCSTKFKQEV